MCLSTTRRYRVGSHTFHLQEHLRSTQTSAVIDLLAISAEASGPPLGNQPEVPMLSLVKGGLHHPRDAISCRLASPWRRRCDFLGVPLRHQTATSFSISSNYRRRS
jgi:hypothetical protein